MTEQQIIETLATKVMGWELDNRYFVGATRHECFLLPDGSRVFRKNWNPRQNIADAIQVAEKFGVWQVTKMHTGEYRAIIAANKNKGYGKTAQEAICNAALKVVEVSE